MRRAGLAVACTLAIAACNPVETSRSFDSSRGTKRFAVITRFPADIVPRVFEQDGEAEPWSEVAVEGASTIGVMTDGARLTVPVAEEVLILEYYAEELALKTHTPPQALGHIRIFEETTAKPCSSPLCYKVDLCSPQSPQLVDGPDRSIGILSEFLVRCP